MNLAAVASLHQRRRTCHRTSQVWQLAASYTGDPRLSRDQDVIDTMQNWPNIAQVVWWLIESYIRHFCWIDRYSPRHALINPTL